MAPHQVYRYGHRHIIADHGGCHGRTHEGGHVPYLYRAHRGGVRASIWNPRKKDIQWGEAHASVDDRTHEG
jgi:hypothetical protein